MACSTEVGFRVSTKADGWTECQSGDDALRVRKSQMHLQSSLILNGFRNADSVIDLADGSTMFVKPHEQDMSFSDVSTYIAKQEKEDAKGTILHNLE